MPYLKRHAMNISLNFTKFYFTRSKQHVSIELRYPIFRTLYLLNISLNFSAALTGFMVIEFVRYKLSKNEMTFISPINMCTLKYLLLNNCKSREVEDYFQSSNCFDQHTIIFLVINITYNAYFSFFFIIDFNSSDTL